MRRLIFITLLSAKLLLLNAQDSKYLNKYVQPAPNAASLGKFIDFPVSLHTGLVNVNIPLYRVQDGAVSLDLSLSYHASGIRVSEVASWVGLGWTLNAGGALIRTVVGVPDEGTKVGGGTNSITGYYKDFGLTKMPADIGDQPGTAHNVNGFWPKVIDINGQAGDGESDIYFFSCNGHSGKFMFDENRTPRLLTEGDYRIAVTFDGSNFTSWVITAPDGVQYYFGENSKYEVTKTYSNRSGYNYNSAVPSSWQLTRIVYPNTKDQVIFSYTSESTYGYYDLGTESMTDADYNKRCQQIFPNELLKTIISGQRLTGIQSGNFRIEFNGLTNREDLVLPYNETTIDNAGPNNVSKRLDNIKIYNSSNECIKQFDFSFSYFVSSTATGLSTTLQGHAGSTDMKRLKLNAVTERSGDGVITKPATQFLYDESVTLPRRLSYDQDHWGYYNNSQLSGYYNTKFMPADPNDCWGGNAIRDAHATAMKGFILKQITYPTGGNTVFEYEAHKLGSASTPRIIGGLRVSKVAHKDHLTGTIQVKKYSYIDANGYSNGILYNDPVYFRRILNEYLLEADGTGTTSPVGYIGYGSTSNIWGFTKSSSNIVPLQSFQGNHIGYSNVKEIYGENGEGGSIEYIYKSESLFSRSSRLHQNNYVYRDFNGANLPNGQFQTTQPQDLQYYTSYDYFQYYPGAPNQTDLLRGSLISLITKDANGNLVKKIVNTYQEKVHETYWMRGLKVVSLFIPDDYNQPGLGGDTEYLLTYYKIRTGYSYVKTTEETTAKDGMQVTTMTDIAHESPYHTLPTTVSTTTSNGELLVKQTIYSLDYNNGVAPNDFYGKLKSRNMLVPLEERTWKGGKLIAAVAKEYKDFSSVSTDMTLQPYKVFELKTEKALSSAQVGLSEALSYPYASIPSSNSYYVPQAQYTYNGSTGNISEQRLTNNIYQAYIWDYKTKYPIAQVSNAMQTEIAYTSFEAEAPGNWAGINAVKCVSNASMTGRKSYYDNATFSLSKSGLSATKTYIVSYWSKNGTYSVNSTNGTSVRSANGWNCYEHKIVNPINGVVTVTGTGYIDELRLHPDNAQMVTYTYDPLIGMTSITEVNNASTRYVYDLNGRLLLIQDENKNVLKKFCYNYDGQNTDCSINNIAQWQPTGNYQCVKDASNNNTGYQNREEKDVNPLSATYNTFRWVSNGLNSTACLLPNSTISIMGYNKKAYSYNLKFTNTSTLAEHLFTLDANTTTTYEVGKIPPGTYNVQFYMKSTSVTCTYEFNGSFISDATGATFQGRPVNGTSTALMY